MKMAKYYNDIVKQQYPESDITDRADKAIKLYCADKSIGKNIIILVIRNILKNFILKLYLIILI